jgi:hypothetical protein
MTQGQKNILANTEILQSYYPHLRANRIDRKRHTHVSSPGISTIITDAFLSRYTPEEFYVFLKETFNDIFVEQST